MVKIKWTNQAKQDLIDIAEYIAINSKKYAKIQVLRIRERVVQLKSFPKSGRIVSEFKVDSIRELILGNYRIIYKLISAERIDIIAIHHSARKLKTSG